MARTNEIFLRSYSAFGKLEKYLEQFRRSLKNSYLSLSDTEQLRTQTVEDARRAQHVLVCKS